MKPRIYIAGPISIGDLIANIKQATDAAVALMKAGFAPFCPHLTCYMAGPTPEVLPHGTVHDDWYGIDLPWVSVSQGVLRLLGQSKGADLETQLAEELGIPVFKSVDEILQAPPDFWTDADEGGNKDYLAILDEMRALHLKKSADYGTDADPLANLRGSAEFGVEPWLGALIRFGDKVKRLQTYCKKGTLANEGVEDSLMDAAAYPLLALVFFREKNRVAP